MKDTGSYAQSNLFEAQIRRGQLVTQALLLLVWESLAFSSPGMVAFSCGCGDGVGLVSHGGAGLGWKT